MKSVICAGPDKPDRQEKLTAADIAEGLKCGDPSCICAQESGNG